MTANGTNFINDGGGTNITFTSTATLSGEHTNTFNMPIIVPYTLVPSLAGNTSFDQVAISAGTISSGTLSLNLLGTNTTSFFYQFNNGFTVGAGGTMAVGANVPLTVVSTLSDAGNVTFTTGDQVTFDSSASTVSGSLTANGTNFINGGANLTFTSTATLSGGTNSFNTLIFVPYTLVPSLAGNTSFDEVGITAGTISSGTLSLNLLGTNTANFFYEFPNGFTVGAGGTMAVGANVPVTVVTTLSDAGTVTFASGDQVNLYSSATSISGSLTANGTNFVNGGGGSTITFTSTATLSGGTNTFNLPIIVPYTLVPSLAGNTSFNEVEIAAGTISSGTLSLNLLGTTTTNFFYDFPNGFTVGAGGTIAVGANVPITVESALSDAGAVSFSSGDAVTLASSATSVSGSLTANGTTFAATAAAARSITFTSTATLGGGTNTFNMPIIVPYTLVPSLAGNSSFDVVEISAGTISSGTLSLNLLGTNTTNFYYEFPSGFNVGAGGTIAVGANVPVTVATTLSDAGNVTFTTGDQVTFDSSATSVSGSLTANDTNFINGGGSNIVVNSGGELNAGNSTFDLSSLTLNSNSTDTLSSDIFFGVTTINSGATINIHGNDFSNVGSQGIVAVGDPNATIDLTANYWGTSNTSQIQAKILDHNVNPTTRPTVNFGSYLTTSPASIVGSVFNDVNGDGVQDSGEPGLGGVVVYIDVNNTGSLVSSDPSTVTSATGQYSFNGLAAGTYIVREVAPSGTVQTDPSTATVTTTIDFDGTGGESGITGAGVSSFTYHGASFSGGTIFAPPLGDSALLASGTLAYNASSTPAQVTFSQPIVAATFFYVHGFGFGSATDVATAFAADGSVVATVSSKAATTNGDPANFVTLTGSKPIVRITFVGGVIDNFTFSTVNNTANSVVLSAGQTVNNVSFGDQFVPGTLEVQSLTPTSTGFTVTFNAPVNTSVLSLYGAGTSSAPVATLVGQSIGPVTGSLVVSPNGETVTFIKTSGLLAADTYTITLVSGANAFESTAGALLDGIGNGVPGSNLTSTFTVSPLASNAVVVSIPDFTRGYGQAVNVPASTTTGLPITISTGQNVSSVTLTLTYNPALLTLSSFTTTIPGAMATANLSTPGTAVITISSATQFSSTAGAITLGDFTAAVPNNATYGSKEILHITNLSVFDDSTVPQPLPSVGQDAIHVAAFFGDTSGDGAYTTQDVTLEQRDIGLVNSGFPFYQMADPVLIGDTTGNGQIQANDTTLIQRVIGQISVPNIPPLPTGITPPPSGGPDPTLFIPNENGLAGAVVTVPVRVTVTEPAGISVSSCTRVLAIMLTIRTSSTVNPQRPDQVRRSLRSARRS